MTAGPSRTANRICTYLFVSVLTIITVSAGPGEEPTLDPRKGPICGAADNPSCGGDEVCEIPAGNCDDANATGTCVPRPKNCTQDYTPVCGCDGKTYSNDCMRLMAGARKSHGGECEPVKTPEPEN